MDLEHCQHQCVLLTDQHPHVCVLVPPPADVRLTSPLLSEHIAASVLEPHYSWFIDVPLWYLGIITQESLVCYMLRQGFTCGSVT